MRWLSLAEVLELHRRLIEQTGGMPGLRDLGLLEASGVRPCRANQALIRLLPKRSGRESARSPGRPRKVRRGNSGKL